MAKKLTAQQIIDKFEFEVVHKGTPKRNFITTSGIARIGILLTTDLKLYYKQQNNIVGFGGTELLFFESSSHEKVKKAIARLKKFNPPLILLNRSWNKEGIKKLVKLFGKTNITIACSNLDSTALYIEVSPWVARQIAPTSQIHGTLMSIYGEGV